MSKAPYGIVSDTHFHNWSAFSTINSLGLNSRLQFIIEELLRAAEEVKKAGGSQIFVAGDVFHVRGKLTPSVLNAVIHAFNTIATVMNIRVYVLPGNHDLENKDSDGVGSAIGALSKINGVEVISEVTEYTSGFKTVVMVPWHHSVEALKETLTDLGMRYAKTATDLIIHAPVNGVLYGIPDHGLHAGWLAKLGFDRVFAGHYHNHKALEDDTVFSVGATTHQTWGDVGSKAGFLIVHDDRVDWRESHAPKFVDLTEDIETVEELALEAGGNYVRMKLDGPTEGEVATLREELMSYGALGVQIMATPKAAATRIGSTAKTGETIEGSVGSYISSEKFENEETVTKQAFDILSIVKAEAA